ncbi:histidine kinase [Rhizocola hellebori]|uniref:histidine kinase n=1 Tax=Rhizocola hellebori TaxID=1392758 RepID=A0A8J3QB31_9ACTN|nr:sensor histidine kinase [Rhizocola hellebori]GIH06443.1 histidine kinase [Rhizocola hellebori]
MFDKGWRRFSTNTLILSGLVILAGLLVAAAIAGTLALRNSAAASQTLTDRLSPALISAERLNTALLDQETGVRGYALTGERRFLEPYHAGLSAEQAQIAQLQQLLAQRPEALAALGEVVELARSWRAGTAEPVITAVESGASATGLVEKGRQDFDRVRGGLDRLEQQISAARQAARDDLTRAMRWQNTVLVGVLIVFLIAAMLVTMLIRSGVGRPMSRLAAATREVSGGDFEQRIAVDGPADLRALGGDIETMRQRIVAALAASVAAQATLQAQAVELERSNADLARSNSELEQFAYVASHDLQEPLRKVASFCQLLERRYGELLDERGKQYVAFAVDGAERMQILINDLLAFSRVGRVYDAENEVDLNAICDNAEQNLTHRVEASSAVIESDKLPIVLGDPTLLNMLWQNLLGNALKFSDPQRPARVEITCRRAGELWEFAVKDNGIGIDPQFADKIFVIFQRLHSRGDVYGGTGIGLAMCRKIVEHHGGTIWLDSQHSGPGSTFRFTLPARNSEESP